ncbi:MAG: hypothetical protein IKR84_01400, partial [Oscillibacter sp.]|nr:hypothetical protein [Oscillibacter sp.]
WAELCEQNGKTPVVSVGGLDSITLLLFVRKLLGPDIVGASVSALEDKSIQDIHRKLGVVRIAPKMNMAKVLNTFGFPVISKAVAKKIEHLQIPPEQADKRTMYYNHALMTGETGPWGHFRQSESMKLPDKYLELFGGLYNDQRQDLQCKVAPFKVSAQCCHWMKELPAWEWQEEHSAWPFLGLMQSEGGQRRWGLQQHGCNYIGKSTARFCPFNHFSRQDLLHLARDLNAPVPAIYGEIIEDADGRLRTTRAQRTGCACCGFGVNLDKRPHHFDLLRERNEKEWEFWMYKVCTDPETGEKYGWGRVLDWIGVEWEAPYDGNLEGQLDLLGGWDE